MQKITIHHHAPGTSVSDFLAVADIVFAGDPAWVAPLRFEIKDRLNPKKNPAFDHTEAILFTARRDGELVGRASASVDQAWQKEHGEAVGHFGFLDTIDDQQVVNALLAEAEAWLRERGVTRICGPMSLVANEEIGILVDGFEHPPVVMMGHSRPYQGALVEGAGYTKEKDLLCWRFDASTPLSKRTLRAWEEINALDDITLRSIDMKRLNEELAMVVDIYNEAWAGKWGFVPISQAEVEKMADDLKMVLDPEMAFVAIKDNEPVGMCIVIPNLNEVIADLNGRLFPTGWAKLLWRLKVNNPKSARLILLGIRERIRKNFKRYGGLSAAMYVEVAKRGVAKGYEWSELSWTREDDKPINLGIRSMGAKVYKTYRVYEKKLT